VRALRRIGGEVMSANNGSYQTCACEWKDGKVISFCAAHQMAANDIRSYTRKDQIAIVRKAVLDAIDRLEL
jgi:hypothetical protein